MHFIILYLLTQVCISTFHLVEMLRKKSQKGQISLVTKTFSQLRTQNVEGGTQNEGGGVISVQRTFRGRIMEIYGLI